MAGSARTTLLLSKIDSARTLNQFQEFSEAVSQHLVLEGAADGHLMVDMELTELKQGGMVVLDRGMRRLEVELGHRFKVSGKERESLASLWKGSQ